MASFLDILTGGIPSSLIGAAGGIVTAVLQGRQEKQRMDHELAMAPVRNAHELAIRDMDLKQIQVEKDAQVAIARDQAESQAEVAQLGALAQSYQHDAALHASGSWVMRNIIDPLAASVRPVSTAWAGLVLSYLTILLLPVMRVEVPKDPARAWEMIGRIVAVCEFIFAWWFAARMTSQRGKK